MKHVGLDVYLKYMLLLKCCCQSELHRYYRVKTLDIDIYRLINTFFAVMHQCSYEKDVRWIFTDCVT